MEQITKITEEVLKSFIKKYGHTDGVQTILEVFCDTTCGFVFKFGEETYEVLYMGVNDKGELTFWANRLDEYGEDTTFGCFFALEQIKSRSSINDSLLFMVNSLIGEHLMDNFSKGDTFIWSAFSNDGAYEEKSTMEFKSLKECYEDMRSAVLDKMCWNTEFDEDFDWSTKGNAIFEHTNAISYKVMFYPYMITHKSYSGKYFYNILVKKHKKETSIKTMLEINFDYTCTERDAEFYTTEIVNNLRSKGEVANVKVTTISNPMN